jgi:dihydrofolate reductase
MAMLTYTAIASLDGYVADEDGRFERLAPDAEVHAFVNDIERPVGTYLMGRALYDVMKVWETMDDDEPEMRDYAQLWRAADKVVYSTTLEEVAGERTRIEREFDPDAVRAMKEAAGSDLSVGGPHLAAQALKAGLVDEVRLFLCPVTLGGGNAVFPDGLRADLELIEERRFGNGVVYMHYRVATG